MWPTRMDGSTNQTSTGAPSYFPTCPGAKTKPLRYYARRFLNQISSSSSSPSTAFRSACYISASKRKLSLDKLPSRFASRPRCINSIKKNPHKYFPVCSSAGHFAAGARGTLNRPSPNSMGLASLGLEIGVFCECIYSVYLLSVVLGLNFVGLAHPGRRRARRTCLASITSGAM